MEQILPIIFIFIVIVFITLCYQKAKVSKILDELEEGINEYNKYAKAYNEHKALLRVQLMEYDLSNLEWQRSLMNNLLDFLEVEQKTFTTYRELKNKINESGSKLNAERMTHNIIGGGANDLSAFMYYSNEKRYNELIYTDLVDIDNDNYDIRKILVIVKEKIDPNIRDEFYKEVHKIKKQ